MSARRRRDLFELMRSYFEDWETFADELLGSARMERPSWDIKSCCLEPLCNVFVAADEVVVTADLPNIDPKTINVEATNASTIEIKAGLKRKIRFHDLGITHREGEFTSFRCQTHIPVPVDMKKMEKRFKRGILEVRIPRKKGHRIKVK
jgi:HSP20 family molecular chaperone IbpA